MSAASTSPPVKDASGPSQVNKQEFPKMRDGSDDGAPLTPPSPQELDSDVKGLVSRKREREVSLEPATPKTDDTAEDRRTPAPKKKNRMSDSLEPTREESPEDVDDPDTNEANIITPPDSPNKFGGATLGQYNDYEEDLSTSPPYETKVKQISRKVKGMKWGDRERDRSQASAASAVDVNTPQEGASSHLQSAAEIARSGSAEPVQVNDTKDAIMSKPTGFDTGSVNPPPDSTEPRTPESEPEDHDRTLKRKVTDRLPSESTEPAPPKKATSVPAEASKRGRDEEEDANPREKKRPTPPPESRFVDQTEQESGDTEPAAPQPKVGGFLAYASTSSPFASARGPSVFGQKSTPSPTPLAGTSNGTASSFSSSFGMKSSSPFAIAASNKSSFSSNASPFASASNNNNGNNGKSPNAHGLSSSPTGTKRSGFEAFASASSPFAAAASRSKSPTGSGPGLSGLARSKSPPRRAGSGSSMNAFKAYAGNGSSLQSFAAPSPPVKKLKQDSGDEVSGNGDEGSEKKGASVSSVLEGGNETKSPEGSEEEAEKPTTFADRLRATSNALDSREGSEEDDRPVVTEQEVQTGEEEEDTIFQVRGKLYSLSTQNAWKERGTGLLKLNVRKSDGEGARLVMRKEAVYALLLNVTLFKGMRCTLAQDPRYVRFSCIENDATVHYNLRLSNAKVAAELIEEINANIPSDEADDAV